MIVAKLTDGRFVIGLDAENLKRLTSGQPIAIDLTKLGGRDVFCIMYGATMTDIQNEIEDALGEPLPAPMPLPDAPRRH